MPHETPNPHDAEEQLRPYLGRVHEATEAVQSATSDQLEDAATEEANALSAALNKALELLGVRS